MGGRGHPRAETRDCYELVREIIPDLTRAEYNRMFPYPSEKGITFVIEWIKKQGPNYFQERKKRWLTSEYAIVRFVHFIHHLLYQAAELPPLPYTFEYSEDTDEDDEEYIMEEIEEDSEEFEEEEEPEQMPEEEEVAVCEEYLRHFTPDEIDRYVHMFEFCL